MFVDIAKVAIKAGKGGDGAVSFRHEKYVDKGGPDGGDGGRGGDVIFKASKDVNTLLSFRYKPELHATVGQAGSKRNKRGRSGEPLHVTVPIGTVVRRDGVVVADLTEDNEEVVIAKGGDGGFGNAHFKSSVRQAPRIAELGEPGDEFEGELELKLLADVGLVGFPNAGKSTLLSVVSNARPEIANYQFTTLTPNLGVADIDDGSVLIADIPGLIEGASEGKGLGDQFLRHVERTAVLLHMIDVYDDDVAQQYKTIRRELEQYSPELLTRPEIVVLTKCEGLDDDIIAMQTDAVASVAPDRTIMTISSQTGLHIKELLRTLREVVVRARQEEATPVEVDESTDQTSDDLPVIRLRGSDSDRDQWQVTKDNDVFVVHGEKIEKFARRTNFEQFEAVDRLRDIMRKLGISHELIRRGAEGDTVIRIGDDEFTLLEQ